MPKHVRMDWKRHFGGQPKPRHHPTKGNCGHRSAALAHEDISSGPLFALETTQGAKFYAGQWMDGREPIFKSIDVQAAVDEVLEFWAEPVKEGSTLTKGRAAS
jgi:hypothetical protein